MANLYTRYFLWFFFLNISVVLSASKRCTGDPDVNSQLRTALSFTKTKEFEDLFNLVRSSKEWEEYANYIKNTFAINIESFIQNADPNDTIQTFKRKVLHYIPLDIQMRYLFARWSLDFETGIALYKNLSALPEVQTIMDMLCSMYINLEDIAAALM